jgi:amino acid transporter
MIACARRAAADAVNADPLNPPASPPVLARRLGLWSSIGLVIGVTIGSGIFRTPAVIAARVPDPMLMLGVWIAGGMISLCGALSVAELASRLPHTGGWYVYLREAWGRPAAFLFGWSELVLIRASASGAIATVFSEYALSAFGYEPGADTAATDYLAAIAIAVAAAINIRGVRLGALCTGLSTIAKVGALLAIVALAFLWGPPSGGPAAAATGPAAITPGLAGLALISVLWAYDGFADVSFAAGEVRDASRTLPRAIVLGTLSIIAIYLAVNLAYLHVTPVAAMAGSRLIAADTMQALVGPVGRTLVAAAVAVSALGALIGTMLVAPRVFFAMASDRLFFPVVARVHPRYGTPHVAIGLAAVLGVGFVLTRSFEQLADTFVLSIWPFYGLAVAGLFRLRQQRSKYAQGYTVPMYPWLPLVFIGAVVYLVGSAVVADPMQTGLTFGVVLVGLPVYFWAFAGKPRRQR